MYTSANKNAKQFETNKQLFYNGQLALLDYINSKNARVISQQNDLIDTLTQNNILPSFGMTSYISIFPTVNGESFLIDGSVKLSMPASTVLTGTYVCPVNGLPIYFWSYIQVVFNGKVKQTINSEMIADTMNLHIEPPNIPLYAQMTGYYPPSHYTSAQILTNLKANATAARDYFLPLELICNLFANPLPMWCFPPNALELRFYPRPVAMTQLLLSDGTGSMSFSDMRLISTYSQATPEIVGYVNNLVKNNALYFYAIDTQQRVQSVPANGSSTSTYLYTNPLELLQNLDVVNINFYNIPNTSLSTAYGNNYSNFAGQPLTQFNLKNGSYYLVYAQYDITQSYWQNQLIWTISFANGSGLATNCPYIYVLSFTDSLGDSYGGITKNMDKKADSYCGSMNFDGISQANLNSTFPPSSVACSQYVNIYVARRWAWGMNQLELI